MGLFDGAAARLMAAPRVGPTEAGLAPALDALGGEVVRLRSRDGVRLGGRWLEADARDEATDNVAGAPGEYWRPEPHEAILLLHGYTGSVAPDVVEYGPFLRRTAGVLALDFRGHGGSDAGPTTFGLLETEDVAGALAWLGERGITRVALFGTSMGAITAIEAVAILGDGRLLQADLDPFRPRNPAPPPRPLIVAVVADSAAPELAIAVGSRVSTPVIGRLVGRFVANRVFGAVARKLGADPRQTEPSRVIGLVAPTPLLLIHGESDRTVPIAAARRLAARAGSGSELWTVPGAGHSAAHVTDRAGYEARVSTFLQAAFAGERASPPIIPAEGVPRPADAGT